MKLTTMSGAIAVSTVLSKQFVQAVSLTRDSGDGNRLIGGKLTKNELSFPVAEQPGSAVILHKKTP